MRLGLLTVGLLLPMIDSGVNARRCPDSWTRSGSKCFALVRDKQHWPEAQMTCEVLGGDLAVISNSVENRVVGNMLAVTGTAEAWIGLHDLLTERHFVWRKTNRVPTYTNWNDNQPDNWKGIEHCVTMRRSQKWNDVRSSASLPFVCETGQ
ncbi:collectin-11-like [Littorina saxatilis]|uniref:C-type lectin domain-containing protein n=1 Tax=Littorina saxatilis TaxID=31220 RepID=A0AAN9B999_9CAEN